MEVNRVLEHENATSFNSNKFGDFFFSTMFRKVYRIRILIYTVLKLLLVLWTYTNYEKCSRVTLKIGLGMVISKVFKQMLMSHTSHQYIVSFLFMLFKSN
jgi:hypothetical protein